MRSGHLKDNWVGVDTTGPEDSASAVDQASQIPAFAASTLPPLSAAELFPLTPGGVLPSVVPPPTFLHVTLPLPVVAAPGGTVALSSILTTDFGATQAGPYPEFWIGYSGAATLTQSNFSYWNLSSESVAKWLTGPTNTDIGADTQKQLAPADIATTTFQAGNDIGPFAYFLIPIAFDALNNITVYRQFSAIAVEPALMRVNYMDGAPTPADIVAQAHAFDAFYGDGTLFNNNDCHWIADAVAASAGATMTDNTQSLNPALNEEGGFWRIVYRGSNPNPVANWQTLVKPGDIVRMGWTAGGQHTTTVLAVNPDGSMQVYDNADIVGGVNTIGIHTVNYDTATIATTVTIYRLAPDHLYLINGTAQGEALAGTLFNDRIVGHGGNDTISGGPGNDVLVGGTGNDTMDGGDGNDSLSSGTGNDILTGGNGADTFMFAAGALDSLDSVNGGTDAQIDRLVFTGPETAAATAFAQVAHIEQIVLAAGTNTIALTDAMVGSSDNNHILTVSGSSGNDSVDGSAVATAANRVYISAGGGNDALAGGAGADIFYFASAALNASDTVNGGIGTAIDTLAITTAGTVVAAALAGVSHIEKIVLMGGGNHTMTLPDALAASADDNHMVTVVGGAGIDAISAVPVTATNSVRFEGLGGADRLVGGADTDIFLYTGVSDSTGNPNGTAYDTLVHFNTANDRIDLPNLDRPTSVSTLTDGTWSNVSTFDQNMAAIMGSALNAHTAVVLHETVGTFAGHDFLVVNPTASAGYVSGADYVFDVTGHTGAFATSTFI